MPIKDKWAVSTSEEEVTGSKYAPVVETHCKKKKNNELPSFNNRFPGGGFLARMKKREQQSKEERYKSSKVVSCKMLSRASTSTSSKKWAARKKGDARESFIVKKERNSNTRTKVQTSSCGEITLAVNKEEEVVIEDFDSQELLQDAPVRAAGDSGVDNIKKAGWPKGKDKSEGEMNTSEIAGPRSGRGSSKTVVINSQPQFAPSQLDEREREVLEGKHENCKQGILKKVVCSSKSVQESDPPMNLKKRYELLEGNWSASSVSREHHDDESGMFSNFEEGEDNVLEEEADALADLFTDYEVEEAQE